MLDGLDAIVRFWIVVIVAIGVIVGLGIGIVCRADEPAVIEFLRPFWDHLKTLWEPLS